MPAFAFPAEAGTHLLTPEGWKAELAWVQLACVRFIVLKAHAMRHHSWAGHMVHRRPPSAIACGFSRTLNIT